MTEMPQLVAALHSFVGLAAVFIGFNADIMLTAVSEIAAGIALSDADLTAFGEQLWKKDGVEIAILKVEVFLGIFIGAITFTGSIVALANLRAKLMASRRTDAAKKLRRSVISGTSECGFADHLSSPGSGTSTGAGSGPLFLMTLVARFHRLASDHGYRRRGYAGRCVDAEQLLGLGSGGDWLYALATTF